MAPVPDDQEPLDEQYALVDDTEDSEPLFLVVAQEDTLQALEAERRRMARELQDTVISQLNLMLAQSNVYEQTMTNNAQARMAISVLSTLARQALQQARDLESKLHPMILESLGLEPALESLATQEMRAHGLQVLLSLQRLRERLPVHIELALYRATQDAVERAIRQASASQIYIRLEKRESEIFFSIADNGFAPSGEVLGLTCQRVEGVGGAVELNLSAYGGLEFIIRFTMETSIELTEREMEVIRLVAEGHANKEIAAALYVSPRTVKFHLDNIYSKLGVKTRTEAAIYALRRGWVRQKPGKTD